MSREFVGWIPLSIGLMELMAFVVSVPIPIPIPIPMPSSNADVYK